MRFTGDDTWTLLFPDMFAHTHALPSFNVHDLHTVDKEVEARLLLDLARHDWDVCIAHVLGVDHVGHVYGPSHPEMARKLAQMDKLIDRVVEALPDNTLLVVLGDHGMTRDVCISTPIKACCHTL